MSKSVSDVSVYFFSLLKSLSNISSKILLFFLGFIVQKKFTKKIIYYSDHKLITNNINSFNINKSLLR